MVSYRIPTEDKYSMAPMKIVGFLPREAGDAIMFPYELTEIDDSNFEIDKRYVMRKDIPIILDRRKAISTFKKELLDAACESYKKAHNGQISAGAVRGFNITIEDLPNKHYPEMDDFEKSILATLNELIKKTGRYDLYKTIPPTEGKAYRDNKIVSMTYGILTNRMTADKILNPGGFEEPKKIAYLISAFKNSGKSWNELINIASQPGGTDKLKKLSYVEKDLTFADTQIQFYKQNSAARYIIRVFSVHNTAHAVLEGDGIYADVEEVCGVPSITIGDFHMSDKVELDPSKDAFGNLLGKTLGSLVSASADAAKDPILNLINVNMTTAGMLCSMLRIGMDFETAALFLSQDVITNLLTTYNRENLSNYMSLDSIIDSTITMLEDSIGQQGVPEIDISKKELLEGLLPADFRDISSRRDALNLSILYAFRAMRNLANTVKKPTFATRFNSISAAVGPLIIDNLITKHKIEDFTLHHDKDGKAISTGLYQRDVKTGELTDIVTIDSIFDKHPILKNFAETLNIADTLFRDMPIGSTQFSNLLNTLPDSISSKLYSDKKLFDKFAQFYLSYMAVASGLVDPKELFYMVNTFPAEYNVEEYKQKYPENPLIQAITKKVAKSTGKPYLSVKITGETEQTKELWKAGWIDLHKKDPELSMNLFKYSFFIGGIGFSPKTMMALVPTFVKEKMSSTKDDGSTVSYIDTYTRKSFPQVSNMLVVDQFIRNNWNDNKLVPIRGGKDSKLGIDFNKKTITAYTIQDICAIGDLKWIKVKYNKKYLLAKRREGKAYNGSIIFDIVSPLGNNGEYLEMSVNHINKTFEDSFLEIENEASLERKTDISNESGDNCTANTYSISQVEAEFNSIIDAIVKSDARKKDRNYIIETTNKIKKLEEHLLSLLSNKSEKKDLRNN